MKKKSNHGIVDIIINKRKWIEKIFMILILISLICFPFVGVNYDLTKYLPDYAPSKQGLNLMEQEFGYPGTARVMISDVSIYEAKLYKDKISNVDAVDMVLWADSDTDIYQSNLFINYDNIKDYYKDNCAVMDVTFKGGDSDSSTHKAIDEIKKITGDKGSFMGSAVENKSLSETLSKEISIAMVIAVVLIAIILTLTTNSWFEPVLFLMIMGIAIIINMGTNIIFGTISFLTFSIAAILQLAVAMDYSIFLLHSFTRERQAGLEPTQAIANAVRTSVISILSSGATTIVGFIVLALMNFKIGSDMGFVLAKGIVISLITVLLLMPALILRWSDKIEKTAHRMFIPPFNCISNLIYKSRYVLFAVVVLLVLPAYVGQTMNNFTYGNSALGASKGTVVYDDTEKINKIFGRSNLILAMIPNDSLVTEKKISDDIEDLYYVKSVTSIANKLPEGVPESIIPKSITNELHTDDYSRIMIFVKSSDESDLAYEASDKIKSIVNKYYPGKSYVVGVTPSTQDIKDILTKDYNRVNIISLIGVIIVVMITFKSGIIPIVVMIPIQIAIFFNMAIPYLIGDEMMYMGYIIVSCIQLGATIDYSILLTNNYLDARTQYDKKESALHAISRSALSILTSGTILTTVGYGLYFTSTVNAVAGIGRLVGRGALFSMILVLGLLPMLLLKFDKIIFSQKARMEKLLKFAKARNKKIRLTARNRLEIRHKKAKERRKKISKALKGKIKHKDIDRNKSKIKDKKSEERSIEYDKKK
ncbi:efflux RND transporter permease subunit [Clostridium sp. BJN0001]|uniref:efflux RND transporter permease subunit n=1 Tax=Clostridium sp. BJN0001 TaxID=2930219 RepID=UPI001FD4C94F|nr:efflux RND transporter permease subunit [Clostridium sp. BJN0001]